MLFAATQAMFLSIIQALLFFEDRSQSMYWLIVLTQVSSFLLLWLRYKAPWSGEGLSLAAWSGVLLGSFALAGHLSGDLRALVLPAVLFAAVLALLYRTVAAASVFGWLHLTTMVFLPLLGAVLIAKALLSPTSLLNSTQPAYLGWLLRASAGVQLVLLLVAAVSAPSRLLPVSKLYFPRRRLLRSRAAAAVPGGDGPPPKVAIHLACYSEPPEVVVQTMDALARLDYPDFEVLVIDNNTTDPALWRPLEERCRSLGPRFRFFHVERLAGAKAGALNFALRHTSEDTVLVCTIDADYVVEPDFLRRCVPLFRDPKTAFVQTTHEYRDWERRPFLRALYFEYMVDKKLILAAKNEWDAAYTVGTMSVIRRSAIQAAGGWAEWCVTEDSELAVRLHGLGCHGYYFADVFGRGLIPETLHEFKQQRFRWSIGPIQYLKRHWRRLLPWDRSTRLTFAQRYWEMDHSFECVGVIMMQLCNVASLATCLALLASGRSIAVPPVLWALLPFGLLTGLLHDWIPFRLIGGRTVKDFALMLLAIHSLHFTNLSAFTQGWLPLRFTFRRTSKFRETGPSRRRALRSTLPELVLSASFAAVGAFLLAAAPSRSSVLQVTALGFLLGGAIFCSAPLLALLAERDLLRIRQGDGAC